MTTDVVLCEVCGGKLDGMAVVWGRGFTAVCCISCACELARLLREGRIHFGAENAKDVVSILARRKRPSWNEVSKRVLEEHRPLWEALAAV